MKNLFNRVQEKLLTFVWNAAWAYAYWKEDRQEGAVRKTKNDSFT